MPFSPFDESAMRRALELARRGEGRVEPNPLVGAVIAAADGDGGLHRP
jgi:pyrimidine deaminase RibD-like protein